MDVAGVPGNSGVPEEGMVFCYPSNAEDQPRPMAPAPPGRDTGTYIIPPVCVKSPLGDCNLGADIIPDRFF